MPVQQTSVSDIQLVYGQLTTDTHLNVHAPSVSLGTDIEPLKNTKQTDFAALQPRLTASSASLFLYPSQVETDYHLVFEFFAATLDKGLFLSLVNKALSIPWFILTRNTKTRLSGWKDANLLYRAVNTYHN
ncbi:hypothetical protein [Pseudoalteromonas mariniglutinosa]|uniref:hypothetical protein n=1 Tax=Pseudoalteromonas mariniglutinosa TaxID=206042 RepID=UPI00384DF5EE